MAAFRNLAICALRLAGYINVTEVTPMGRALHEPPLRHPRTLIMTTEQPWPMVNTKGDGSVWMSSREDDSLVRPRRLVRPQRLAQPS